ncbi:MAG: HTH domain-containing protein [Nanoarchaeota archaeon]|jgi:GTP-sensing pleiotropic transcriptional regulator CodY|nr:HTH domain-containing protein [Nanoarchaeota archaeon]
MVYIRINVNNVFFALNLIEGMMKAVDKILKCLENNKYGLTITNLVDDSGLSRSAIRTGLARLEGAQQVKIRCVGMAKVYSVAGKKK